MAEMFDFLSPYADSFERKVDRFFRGITSRSGAYGVRKKLLKLMQRDLVMVNLWLERKFKGYKYLRKGVRRRMYANRDKIVKRFEEYRFARPVDVATVKRVLNAKSLRFSVGDEAQMKYLAEIMGFLRPGERYQYLESSNFGRLFADVDKEKMIGDCNQIVTFYIYLFSLKFPIDELKIKLLPDHVCLHYKGVDIEATNGSFAKYQKYEELLPVTEIISTNLLDISDDREVMEDIDKRTLLKSAQLAYSISSLKSLVQRNLDAAYTNFALFFAAKGDYRNAKFYAAKTQNQELKKTLEHNSAVKEYNRLADKVRSVQTVEDAKKHKADYKKMLQLARKLGDNRMVDEVNKILRQI